MRVGPELGEIAVRSHGPDGAAHPLAGLVHHDPRPALLQAVRRRQSGDAAADDRYRSHAEASAVSSAASSASPCTAEVNDASNADGGR